MAQALESLIATETDDLRFFDSLNGFCKAAALQNIRIKSTSPESISKYSRTSPQERIQIQKTFENYASLIQPYLIRNALNVDLNHEEQYSEADLLKYCLSKFGLEVQDEIYSKLTNEDIIEVYSKDMNQIYRNLSFFNLCSYDLMDLLINPPYELYERSLQVNHLLVAAERELSAREYSLEPLSLRHIPKHLMREKFSDKRLSFLIQFKEVYPLYTKSKEYFGLLVLQQADVVKNPSPDIVFL